MELLLDLLEELLEELLLEVLEELLLEIIERGAREGPVIFFLFFSLFQAFRTIWRPDSESS